MRRARPAGQAEQHVVTACPNAQAALVAGVTIVRDCGASDFSMLALRDAIARGEFVGPRVLAYGIAITTTADCVDCSR